MDFTLPENLPSIANAQLPKNYEAAKVALAACNQIDECKDWADKSAALASYAKMADDDELYNFAVRVKARAIRRCGELLQQIEKGRGGQPSHATRGDAPPSRNQTARDAGLSDDQRKDALRLASIPAADFDETVESDTPPTITRLAEQGTVKKATSPADIIGDRDPADFRAATEALGTLNRFVELTQRLDPAAIGRGCSPRERVRIGHDVDIIFLWLTTLEKEMHREEERTETPAAEARRH